MSAQLRNWTPDRLPDLNGKTYLVTGGNSGIGLETSRMLAAAGADVVIACRNPAKAKKAVARIVAAGAGIADSITLDLASMDSVREAAAEFRARYDRLDALINNAGIMQTPRTRTVDGFELQFATNHLGHFLLAGLLFDLVEKVDGRIVTVSSIGHRFGSIHPDDVMLHEDYTPTKAYTQSKLANVMFTLELDRRLRSSGSKVRSIACHPGYSATNLQETGPSGVLTCVYKVTNGLMAQSARKGAIPTVLAAAGVEARSGGYYGPRFMSETRGPVGNAEVAKHARDEKTARRLWELSEILVNFRWPVPQAHRIQTKAYA